MSSGLSLLLKTVEKIEEGLVRRDEEKTEKKKNKPKESKTVAVTVDICTEQLTEIRAPYWRLLTDAVTIGPGGACTNNDPSLETAMMEWDQRCENIKRHLLSPFKHNPAAMAALVDVFKSYNAIERPLKRTSNEKSKCVLDGATKNLIVYKLVSDESKHRLEGPPGVCTTDDDELPSQKQPHTIVVSAKYGVFISAIIVVLHAIQYLRRGFQKYSIITGVSSGVRAAKFSEYRDQVHQTHNKAIKVLLLVLKSMNKGV